MSRYDVGMDFATAEREAWQRGDMAQAAAFALALDAEEAQAETEQLRDIVDGIRERITEANWRTGKKAELRELVEAIIAELAEGEK